MKKTFAIVGCGKIGSAFGTCLAALGHKPLGFASKTLSSAKKAAGKAGCDVFAKDPVEVTKEADIVFIATPDGVIEDVCADIANRNGFKKGGAALHCSGALPSTILKSANMRQAFTGSIHPLQSFSSDDFSKNPFAGIIVAIEGQEPAARAAKKIAEDLGAEPITIRTEAKILYHASAVIASNYFVTLVDVASRLVEKAGVSDRDAIRMLSPLLAGTLGNIKKSGIAKALTGPIARGDVGTVQSHMEELEKKAPQFLRLYKELGSHTVDVAKTGKTLSGSAAKKLKYLFSQSGDRRK